MKIISIRVRFLSCTPFCQICKCIISCCLMVAGRSLPSFFSPVLKVSHTTGHIPVSSFFKKIWWTIVILWGHWYPFLDFWWRLLLVSKPGWAALFALGGGGRDAVAYVAFFLGLKLPLGLSLILVSRHWLHQWSRQGHRCAEQAFNMIRMTREDSAQAHYRQTRDKRHCFRKRGPHRHEHVTWV